MTVTSSSDSNDGDEGTGDDDDDIEGKTNQLSSTTRIKNNEEVKNILSKYNGDGRYCTHGDDKRDVNGKKEKQTITIRHDHVSVSDTVSDDTRDIVGYMTLDIGQRIDVKVTDFLDVCEIEFRGADI